MSNKGYIFFKTYLISLLDKFKKQSNKYNHCSKILDIKYLWNSINSSLLIEDGDYYYATMLIYLFLMKGVVINYNNIEYYSLGSLLLSHKFNDDFAYNNIDWATSLGYSLKEINQIERELLNLLDFNIYINKVKYYNYKILIEKNL